MISDLRVSREIAPALIEYLLAHGVRAGWHNVVGDAFVSFEGTTNVINKVHAFVCGWEAAKAGKRKKVRR